MKRIFSGMQPTNNLHLGNYLGALKNWVALQDEGAECLYCVVDLHAITQPYNPDILKQATREIAAAYIACGVDPTRSTIFVQSAVPGHSQAMWLLSTIAQLGKLERMTQFKDKAGKNTERVGLGLFAYPVLMAADILIYKATHVPVGEDQKQHLELARELAGTFNHRYGEDFFPLPEPFITGPAPRVMSLRDGSAKMSKSAESDMSRINLSDDADLIAKKIKKAKTDSDPLPDNLAALEGRLEAMNLLTLYAALSNQSKEDVLREFAGQPFSVFKPALIDLAVAHISPIADKMRSLMQDSGEIDAILMRGAERAHEIAGMHVDQMYEFMGFWRASR